MGFKPFQNMRYLGNQVAWSCSDAVRGLRYAYQGGIDFSQLQALIELFGFRNRGPVISFSGQQHGRGCDLAHE